MRRSFRSVVLFLLAFVVAALPGTTSASTTPARLAPESAAAVDRVETVAPILVPVTLDELIVFDVPEPLLAPVNVRYR